MVSIDYEFGSKPRVVNSSDGTTEQGRRVLPCHLSGNLMLTPAGFTTATLGAHLKCSFEAVVDKSINRLLGAMCFEELKI